MNKLNDKELEILHTTIVVLVVIVVVGFSLIYKL